MHAKDRILLYLDKHPNAKNCEVAAALGLKPAYVSTVRQRANCLHKPENTYAVSIKLSQANYEFVIRDVATTRGKLSDVINAIVTDARLEEEPSTQADV